MKNRNHGQLYTYSVGKFCSQCSILISSPLLERRLLFFLSCQQHKACTVVTEFSSIHSTVKNISLKEIDRGISLSAAVA